ncbi:MAG TPA: ABC transporter substrate-binding protein [Gammaproteobacteria bacterium]|nr:ABC transporter substrate-binding protein [Gammaproteobacteria bacterium]
MSKSKLLMMLGCLVFIASLLPGPLAQARTLQQIKKSGYITIVTTASDPPHSFLDPQSNQLKGIMVAVGKDVAKHIGVKPRFKEVQFSGLIPTLKAGRADFMSAPLFITKTRAKQIDFSDPVYGWGEGIVVNDSNTHTYHDFKDLAGQHVGALEGSVQLRMLNKLPNTKVTTYPDYVHLLADLHAGRIDVALVDPPSIAYIMKTKHISGAKLVTTYKPVHHWNVGMAVRKGNTSLLRQVNAALKTMKNNGQLEAILKNWGVGQLIAK